MNKEFQGSLEYCTAFFEMGTMERQAGRLVELLRSVATPSSEGVERSVWDLPIMAEEEEMLLDSFNQTRAGFPEGECVHELVEAQVASSSERVAVEFVPTREQLKLAYRGIGAASLRYSRMHPRSNG